MYFNFIGMLVLYMIGFGVWIWYFMFMLVFIDKIKIFVFFSYLKIVFGVFMLYEKKIWSIRNE